MQQGVQKKVIRVPSIDNNRPFEKTRTKNKKKPNANGDMSINIQLMNQVDTNGNEKGIVKVWLILYSSPQVSYHITNSTA
jgi:hypothetical protein